MTDTPEPAADFLIFAEHGPELFIPLKPGEVVRFDMDHSLKGVTVERFIETLRDAVANLGVVQPAELRAPLALWLRATEERAVREEWKHLLGRPVVSAWNAARAVVDAAGR